MKKAVDFQNNRIQASDLSTSVENQLVSELLLSYLSGKDESSLVEIPLPKGQLLKLEILEEGLYSGTIVESESNDIIHEITKQTFQQVVDNVVAKNLELRKLDNEMKKEEPKQEIEHEKETNITININLTKAIEDFMSNLNKSISVDEAVKMILTDKMQVQDVLPKVSEEKRDDVLKRLRKEEAKKSSQENESMEQNAELKNLIKSILLELPEKIDEDALIKSYEKAKALLEPKQAVQLIKSIVDKKYPKPVKKAEVKLFSISGENEEIAKSIESLKEIGNDIVDFSTWDDDLTEQQKIIKANIEKYTDLKKSE